MKTEVAKEFNIPLSLLSTILKNHDKIIGSSDAAAPLKDRKRIHGQKYAAMEGKLLEWYHEMHATNLPLSGHLV
ncbi:hypothetical protein PR048_017444 [Dryococelus australis]|uniref:HTH psq-type domain-containing protein n=1 Tax=Dryococelus australis TaxID=614101 RepID=A0ABQ9H9S6_9NEOP|nr:hypothetical protein PR048_017444 [Dryococelus australis]